jgi:predicted dehydrogenase/aryl-alcohol dehydrogenase-like predicted oxidoreductase
MTMAKKLNWGILGTGSIAHAFAKGVLASKKGALVAVGSRTQASADTFADQYGISTRHANYEALLADPQVQAVYVCTPHPMHAEWAIRAAEAGKHVLCEKPIAVNYPEAMAMVEAARENDVFLMEAFMYRCHPQTTKLVELIREKAIGDVKVIQAAFGFHAGFSPESRLYKNDLAGGGIMDVGCYPVSISRLIAGAALGRDFADPVEVQGFAHLGKTGVDEYAIGLLKFEEGILGQVAAGVGLSQENTVRIYGTQGSIFLPTPWAAGRGGGAVSKIIISGSQNRTVTVRCSRSSFSLEADVVAANLKQRQAPSPAMSWADTLGNMRTLDRWRQAVGLQYNREKWERVGTAAGRPLAIRKSGRVGRAGYPAMKYGRIEGLEKQLSRLVMGVDNQGTMTHAAVMFDDYFERGGNCFDTAYIYGGGHHEKLLGQWVKNREIREQVVIFDKTAHTPHCTPEHLKSQLMESLDRLQMSYVDILMAHRDNPEIPVGEFMDAYNELRRAGYVRSFGGSNWPIRRVAAATEYAKSRGLFGFSAVSNNFSLARMVTPVWVGCIHSSDADSRAWFAETQMPLMPWSSQARGFFVVGDPSYRGDESLVTSWYSDDNFQRLARAKELAAEKGVDPINIALAYVLCQPFPTFPLIGPRSLHETSVAFRALNVELTPDEMRWLNLEA